jgi:hypothetical protein
MGFLRRHLFFIICAAVAAGGIALGVLGMKGMPEVKARMEDRAKVYRELQSLASSPVNQERIDVEQRRIDEINADRDQMMAKASEVNHYEQLVDGFFPGIAFDKEEDFRKGYVRELRKLMKMLNPNLPEGEKATPAEDFDFEFWADMIQKEQEEATRELRGVDGPVDRTPVGISGPPYSKGMVLTRDGARFDSIARAHMDKAQKIYCYTSDFIGGDDRSEDGTPSLEFESYVQPIGKLERPSPEALWRAQLGLWIQGDAVRAIAKINDEAAETYRKGLEETEGRRTPPWVGIMPVKEIVSIRLSNDYITAEADPTVGYEADIKDMKAALPGGSSETVFTGTVGTEWYDVLQFTVKLVMDQRDIPELVDEITKNRFHTLLRVSYEAVPVNRRMRGKVYGDDPTVLVIMDFETIMLADPYRCWMPPSVREALGVECPREPEAEMEEETG